MGPRARSKDRVIEPCEMRWRAFIRSERAKMVLHARHSTRDSDVGYGFDPEKYPALAKAADACAHDVRKTRLKRWWLRLRLTK
jgi:hypothetical protein